MGNDMLRKLSLATKLTSGVFLVVAVSLVIAILLYNAFIQSRLTTSYVTSVKTLSHSLDEGVKGSLERGQMKSFQKLLQQQKEIEGVLDVTLYDRRGVRNLSSSEESADAAKQLDKALYDRIHQERTILTLLEKERVKIVTPQIVEPDCIRCHPTWKRDEIGGIMVLTYDLRELNTTLAKQRALLFTGGLGLTLILCVTIFLVSFSFTRPVKMITNVMGRLAKGDTGVDIPAMRRHDEIGQMAQAVAVFKENAMAREWLEQDKQLEARRAEEEKREALQRMADDFEAHVGGILHTVISGLKDVEKSMDLMVERIEQTSTQSATVAQASESTSANVLSVSSATEELTASIDDIAQQVAQSTQSSNNAVAKAEETNHSVGRLADAARKIDEVVELISAIAGQTKLLALNATIEAARAGEAGKGFAVVANEVKELARQTDEATDDIGKQIKAIQSAVDETVAFIRSIGEAISENSDIASSIAAAVAEQGTTTRTIAESITSAAEGARQVNEHISEVAGIAQETGNVSLNMQGKAAQLSAQADRLQEQVERFLAQVRRDELRS